MSDVETVAVSGILSRDASFRLMVSGTACSARDLERLISLLKMMREWMLEDAAQVSNNPTPELRDTPADGGEHG